MQWKFLGLAFVTLLTVAAESASRWEKDIQAFEASDRINPPPEQAVLFVGSSSIRYWTNLANAFPEWKTVRRGFGGAYLSDVNAYFDRLVRPYKPAAIVLYAGENDINAGRSPEEVFAEFKNFAAKVRGTLPKTKIYYLSMKPSPSRWYLWPQISEGNQMIRRFARLHRKIEYVDVGACLLNSERRPNPAFFMKDLLHVNDQGYELWAREIRAALEE
jgi:lysophospholipase L1-like esterase